MKTFNTLTIAAFSIFCSVNSHAFDEKFAKAVLVDQIDNTFYIREPGEIKVAVEVDNEEFRKGVVKAIEVYNNTVGSYGYTAVLVPDSKDADFVCEAKPENHYALNLKTSLDPRTKQYKATYTVSYQPNLGLFKDDTKWEQTLKKLFCFTFSLRSNFIPDYHEPSLWMMNGGGKVDLGNGLWIPEDADGRDTLTEDDKEFIRFVIEKIPNKTPKWKVPQIIRKEIKEREQNERKKR